MSTGNVLRKRQVKKGTLELQCGGSPDTWLCPLLEAIINYFSILRVWLSSSNDNVVGTFTLSMISTQILFSMSNLRKSLSSWL